MFLRFAPARSALSCPSRSLMMYLFIQAEPQGRGRPLQLADSGGPKASNKAICHHNTEFRDWKTLPTLEGEGLRVGMFI